MTAWNPPRQVLYRRKRVGLLTECTWELDVPNLLFDISNLPGLLTLLLDHFIKNLAKMFDERENQEKLFLLVLCKYDKIVDSSTKNSSIRTIFRVASRSLEFAQEPETGELQSQQLSSMDTAKKLDKATILMCLRNKFCNVILIFV